MFSDYHYLMEDGRTSCVQPTCAIERDIKRRNGIESNRDYRQFLVENADKMMTTIQSPYSLLNTDQNEVVKGRPTERHSITYEMSDMKKIYMSRKEMESRMNLPFFSQFELLNYGRKN
jgi:hypothetical protein